MGNGTGTNPGLYAQVLIFKAESQWNPADLVVKLRWIIFGSSMTDDGFVISYEHEKGWGSNLNGWTDRLNHGGFQPDYDNGVFSSSFPSSSSSRGMSDVIWRS